MNELEKRAQIHRKRQKGLSSLSRLNRNAGNVEYNVAMFNHANNSADGPSNNPVSGPFGGNVGGVGMGEGIQKKEPILYVIKDSHGNILSRPNEDDSELWDRVSSMEARGKRGLCVVVYTPDMLKKESLTEDKLSFDSYVKYDELSREEADAASNIDFRIYEEDAVLFIQSGVVDLTTVKEVRYTTTKDDSYDGGYQVIFKDGTKKEFGWKDSDSEAKLYPLTEGNNVSSQLHPSIDSFLQDIAQMYGTISYNDIMEHKYSSTDIKKLSSLRRKFREEAQYEGDPEADAALNKIAQDVAKIVKSNEVKESIPPKKETIELEYTDLEIDEDEFGRPIRVDWTYEVDKDDIYTYIFESCIDENDFPLAFEDDFDPNDVEDWSKFESWLDDNFDEIFDKYEKKILEAWEDFAVEDAYQEYDPDDYVDWDSMPGGHDDDRYWDDLKEGEEVFMEKYSMSPSEEYKQEPRMIDYFEQMNKEDDEV